MFKIYVYVVFVGILFGFLYTHRALSGIISKSFIAINLKPGKQHPHRPLQMPIAIGGRDDIQDHKGQILLPRYILKSVKAINLQHGI